MTMLKKGLMSALILCSASVYAQGAEDVTAAEFELKGVSLGASVMDFQSKFPNATCQTQKLDGGLQICMDQTITFADAPARIRSHFLDGKMVRVAIEKITPEATLVASAPLLEKYGQAKVARKQRDWHLSKHTKQIRSYDMWSWKNGSVELRTQPADPDVFDPDFTWGAIILVDHIKYDEIWWPRSKGKPAASLPNVEVAKGDI